VEVAAAAAVMQLHNTIY